MREPAKSTLGNLLKSFSTKQPSVSKLTHRCWWWSSTPNSCFGTTVHMVIFVRQTYRVFWNIAAKNARWCYGNISSTTAAEQTRAQKCTLSDIIFLPQHANSIIPSSIPGEWKRQKRLIHFLRKMMLMTGIRVKQAELIEMQTHWLCPQH